MADGLELFEAVVSLSGLSKLLAPGIIRRALRDVGTTEATASRADYARAVLKLEARIQAYLEPHDAARRIAQIRRLVGEAPVDTSAAASAPTPTPEHGIEIDFPAPRRPEKQ